MAIWRGVSEDYSPFDIDVTTIPQLSADPTTYMRVMVGGDGAWNGGGAGGIAYVVSSQCISYHVKATAVEQTSSIICIPVSSVWEHDREARPKAC